MGTVQESIRISPKAVASRNTATEGIMPEGIMKMERLQAKTTIKALPSGKGLPNASERTMLIYSRVFS